MTSPPVSELTIVRASPAQQRVIIETHRAEWGDAVPLPTYAGFFVEMTSPTTPWATEGGWVQWALVPRSDTTTLNFLAACHTFRRAAILGPAGSTNVEEVVTYGIGAVYTPPEHRQRGYAKHLMRLLHYILAPRASLPPFPGEWGLAPPTPPGVGGDAAFSELYSGVGDTFYAKCTQGTEKEGWGKRPTVVRQWDLSGKADEVEAVVKAVEEPKGAELEFVSASNLGELEIEAERRIRRDLSSSDTKRTRVAILPRGLFRQQAAWSSHNSRSNALLLTPVHGERPFITYQTDMSIGHSKPTKLCITHVAHAQGAKVPFAAVLAAAVHEGVHIVEEWTGTFDDEAEGMGLAPSKLGNVERCVCLAWYGSQARGDMEDVEWSYCERYGWC